MPHKNYKTSRWVKLRALHLSLSPLCVFCQQQGRTTAASVVDHITPHRGSEDLFWDPDNLQSLCASCHSATKQVQETHGYSQSAGKDGFPLDAAHPWNLSKNV